jgi:hypothetical protein
MLQSENDLKPAEVEARARRHAHSLGKPVEGLRALHLPLEAIQGHAAYKVNAKGDGIVPVARAGRHGRRPHAL